MSAERVGEPVQSSKPVGDLSYYVFYDGGLPTSEDKQIFVVAGRLLVLTRHLTSHIIYLGGFHDQMATTGGEGAFQ